MTEDFPWATWGLSPDPATRYGQLSGCCTPEAIIWATRGEQALKQYLLATQG